MEMDYAAEAFRTVYICKLFHEYGKLDALDIGYTVQEDLWWPLMHEGLENVCGFVNVSCDENAFETRYYFSDPSMMAYYRLCRQYCSLFGVSLKDNPYMQKAEDFVRTMLWKLPGDYGWILHTRINHDWASGIYFVHSEYFDADAHMELLEALLEIFWFYETELEILKQVVADRERKGGKKEAA